MLYDPSHTKRNQSKGILYVKKLTTNFISLQELMLHTLEIIFFLKIEIVN